MDRNVYETLDLRVALHPSEAVDHMLVRVLAYCLEFTEGLEFSKGLDDPDTPALWARDLTGRLTHWIEVGLPSAEKATALSMSSRILFGVPPNTGTLYNAATFAGRG